MKINSLPAIAAILLSACSDMLSIFELHESFEPPQNIQVTGSPSYSVNLGGINKGEPYTLKALGFDIDSLGSAFGSDIKVYDYDYPYPDIKTLLIHYPLKFNMGSGSSISVGDFDDLNDDITTSISLTIPAINPQVNVNIPIPNIQGSTGASLNPALTVPLTPITTPINIDGGDFESAVIETGTLIVTVPNEVSFDSVDIKWAGNSLGNATKGSSNGSDTEWSYSLNGQAINKSTSITISGNITITKVISNLNIKLEPSISKFKSITVKPNVNNPNITYLSVPQVTGVKGVIFSGIRVSFGITVGTPAGAGITGLEPVLNAPDIGFNNAKPSINNGEMIFNADIPPKEGLVLELNQNSIAMSINLGLNGSKPITLNDLAVSANADTNITLSMSAKPDFVLKGAVVNTSELSLGDQLEGSFPDGGGFDLSSINELGGDIFDMNRVGFNNIKLYLYMDKTGLSEDIFSQMKIVLSADYNSNTNFLTNQMGDSFNSEGQLFAISVDTDVYKGPLPIPAIDVDMTEVFNARPSDLSLGYKLVLPTYITVLFDESLGGQASLKADIVIAVPFSLEFEAEDGDPPDFVMININDMLELGSEDIFGRSGPDDAINDYIGFIDGASITLRYNNILGLNGACLFISRNDGGESASFALDTGQVTQTLSIPSNFPDYPFVPLISIGLPKNNGSGKLELKQGEDSGIAINGLEILIKTNIDYTIKL